MRLAAVPSGKGQFMTQQPSQRCDSYALGRGHSSKVEFTRVMHSPSERDLLCAAVVHLKLSPEVISSETHHILQAGFIHRLRDFPVQTPNLLIMGNAEGYLLRSQNA